nr:lysozyme-like [Leptinotarsa decemlineata]
MAVFLFCVFLLGITGLDEIQAKIFTKCGLAQELVRYGFDKTYVGNLKYFCSVPQSVYVILQQCLYLFSDFLDEDIANDSVCAKKIQSELGFRYWEGWTRSCYGRSYPSTIVASCFPP